MRLRETGAGGQRDPGGGAVFKQPPVDRFALHVTFPAVRARARAGINLNDSTRAIDIDGDRRESEREGERERGRIRERS